MSGETDLGLMLRGLKPVLDPRRFVFSTHADLSLSEAAERSPVAMFQEVEGLTLISEDGDGPRYAMITLSVHSSLEAVGLTAAISKALGDADISANVLAAFYHDHVFVPAADADRAVAVLRELSKTAV